MNLALAAAALMIEAAIGYPDAIFRRIRHPVVWIGAVIAALDRRLPRTRTAGAVALAITLAAAALPAAAFPHALAAWPHPANLLLQALLASTLLAQRSLHHHVQAVADGLRQGLAPARTAVAHIVGRDPGTLDHAAVARAAIESLAENFADGVVAPAFWAAVAGLPGIAAYKAANTADSMVGHHTPRHERFGWAAARFDDLVNLPASRLAALWIVLAAALLPGASPGAALRALRRDASRHRSPNAGWPEAAIAGALGLRLAGPRTYAGTRVEDAWMGDGRTDATAADITRALRLYTIACIIQAATLATLAAAATL